MYFFCGTLSPTIKASVQIAMKATKGLLLNWCFPGVCRAYGMSV